MPGPDAARNADLVDACVELYSANYGRWSDASLKAGEPIRLTNEQLLERLEDDAVWVACAFHGSTLIGYCIAVWTDMPNKDRIAWVSQLVVAETYRNARVATRLLYSVWQFSDCFAWGLATANPFAIRALETATRRPCRRALTTKLGPKILAHLVDHVPYLPRELVEGPDHRLQPKVDTHFLLDHSGVPEMRELARRENRPWALGNLDPGEEWFGCTFSEQAPEEIDDARLAELLTGADSIWIQAYEGMSLDEKHAWHRHADSEAIFIVDTLQVPTGATVLDVGCGDGRHVMAFTELGLWATGVDLSERLIERARENSQENQFEVRDARTSLPKGPFDLAVCLYDVLGSSANPDDDRRLVASIASRLKPGAHLAASVMNDGATAGRLKPSNRPSTNAEFIAALERLSPSDTMEQTGAVFNPDLLLFYNGVSYRKEQFQRAKWQLPAELVVRDRRFTIPQLRRLAEAADLEVLDIRPVQSGHWDRKPVLGEFDEDAKELLLLARKPDEC